MQLQSTIEQSFTDYAGAVLQSRALCDARDFLKPSARQIFYCMYTDKFLHNKPFKKTQKAVGSSTRLYIHGDTSCVGIIMRAGQPFSMRYPLIEVDGSYGNLMESANWAAPRYCLTGETLVSTDKGLIKIEDIVKSEENSDNEIPTLTCRGAFGLTTTNLIFNSGLQQTYKLTLKNGIQISGTPNHPILTLNDKLEFMWKTIDELDVGDKILLNVRNNFLYGEENDIEYAKALGCLISEGYLSIENKIDMINSDLDMIMPVQNLLQKYGSKAIYHKRNQKDNCYEISTSNQALHKRLKEDNCTYNSYHKHIPNSVFRGTREYQKEFIRYLFEGDGCISIHSNRYGTIAYSSVSEDLIRELQILLLSNFGIVSFISRQKKRKEIKLEIGGEDAYLFCKNIGFVSDRKNEKAEQTIKFYEENRNKKSTGSRGWRVFPEIRDYLMNYHPEAKLIISRKDRPNECKGPLMSKDGLKILKERLPYEVYSKIEFIYRNFVSIPIIQKEDNGLQVVYSPKINEGCNSFTANGIINHNTGSRLTALSEFLFQDIDKNTIQEWRDNYDDTEKYPMVLPSKGFCNIVNGTQGIGIGMSSSLPQFNLREVNEALIKLLWNPHIDFEEIYCAPDFATGGLLLNEGEVKESLQKGGGKSCKIRSVIEYDAKARCLIVKEVPFNIYTNTICKQLESIINEEKDENGKIKLPNPGIERFNDLTGSTPNIKIYLRKTARPNNVLRFLYKHTSLQDFYSINLVMLQNGRYPKQFTWIELLQEYINHSIEVYIRGYKNDLEKIQNRLHIIAGLLKAINVLDEVIELIKSSTSTTSANIELQKFLNIDKMQASAILEIKLSRLPKLEINKLYNEQEQLQKRTAEINQILNDDTLLKKEVEKGLREVATKFGDARRTQILNIENEEEEVVEDRMLQLFLTNRSNLYAVESSNLYTQNRGGKGQKIKGFQSGEYIISSTRIRTTDNCFLFSEDGKYYNLRISDVPLNTVIPVDNFINGDNTKIIAAVGFAKQNKQPYIIFTTQNGFVKKSPITEYSTVQKNGVKAINLLDNDSVVSVDIINTEPLAILTKRGKMIIINTQDINAIGRNARGVKGITLTADQVISARAIRADAKELFFISAGGIGKRITINEFSTQGRGGKGLQVQKLQADDYMVDFIPLTSEQEVEIACAKSILKVKVTDIPLSTRTAQGNIIAKTKVVGLG